MQNVRAGSNAGSHTCVMFTDASLNVSATRSLLCETIVSPSQLKYVEDISMRSAELTQPSKAYCADLSP